MELTRNDFLFCYDVLLHKKLQEHNVRFITAAISSHGKKFWLYHRSQKVNELLNQNAI